VDDGEVAASSLPSSEKARKSVRRSAVSHGMVPESDDVTYPRPASESSAFSREMLAILQAARQRSPSIP
jgi:hypothetical protein